ncbi:MvdC/MvdD family ATP grasp protein [Nonomuraea sp. NPDC026600]|uniref:MvdC/MvdD family ATP grasp protein n=1 Tax=Nonomuraea sp. NPDC026600 TaxID=3155363 RepID=UPI0033EFF049
MPRSTVMILTQEFDVTADCVVKVLSQREDVEVFRYDTSYFPVDSCLSYASTGSGWLTELTDYKYAERRLDLETVRSIWYRRPTDFRAADFLSAPHREFALSESRHAVGGIMLGLPTLWVNRPDHEARADYKPFQLRLAQELGLRIPDTLISNDPARVRAFYEQCDGRMIYKALNSGLIEDPGGWPGGLLTSDVTSLPDELLQRARYAPGIYQRRVDKAYDLRITVIGDSVTTVRVDTTPADGSPAATDWRGSVESDATWTLATLPGQVEAALGRLMGALRLNYGAVDMAVTEAGEYYFFEVNPSGQFAWLDDEIAGLGLVKTMADYLAAGKTG